MGTTGQYSQESRRPVTEFICTLCGKRTFNRHIAEAHAYAEMAIELGKRGMPLNALTKEQERESVARLVNASMTDPMSHAENCECHACWEYFGAPLFRGKQAPGSGPGR